MPPRIDVKILGEYPYPIARSYYRAYKQSRDDAQIHDRLKDLYEVIVKYLASILISQYVSEGGGDKGITDSLKELDRPSLGHWVGWVRDIISYYNKQKKPLVINELSTLLNEKFREGSAVMRAYNEIKSIVFEQMNKGDNKVAQVTTVREFMELLLQYRNGIAHGGLSNYHRDKVVTVLSPALEELLDKMSFLTRYRMVYVSGVQRASGRTRQYEHYITDLTSNNPSSLREPYIMSNDDAIPEQIYINAADQEYSPALNLHPLLIYSPCPKDSIEQVFVLNEGNESKLSYYSYQCEHSFSPTTYVDDFKALRESLASGNFASLPQPSTPIINPTKRDEPVIAPSAVVEKQESQPQQSQQVVPPSQAPRIEQPTLPAQQIVTPLPPPARNQNSQPPTLPTSNQRSQPFNPPQQQLPVPPPGPSQVACWNCGRMNEMDRANCFNCGANLHQPLGPQPYPPASQPPAYPAIMPPVNPSQQICPRCSTINRLDRKFCTNCGLRLAGVAQPQPVAPVVQPPLATNPVRCPRCGTMNVAGRKFCTSCGLRLVLQACFVLRG